MTFHLNALLLIFFVLGKHLGANSIPPDVLPKDHRNNVQQLINEGNLQGVVEYVSEALQLYGPRIFDQAWPCLHRYVGAAWYALGDLAAAAVSLEEAVRRTPHDYQAWADLGDTYLHQFEDVQAKRCYRRSLNLTESILGGSPPRPPPGVRYTYNTTDVEHWRLAVLSKLYKTMSWTAHWDGLEETQYRLRKAIYDNLQKGKDPGVEPAAFSVVDPVTLRKMYTVVANKIQAPKEDLRPGDLTGVLPHHEVEGLKQGHIPLRVGFTSSDFGVHPVSSLIRGMLQMLSQHHAGVQVFCYGLDNETSWWSTNVTVEVARSGGALVELNGLSMSQRVRRIRDDHLHVVVDLNGHTLGSGLPLLAPRLAPVQVSFLGLPQTTGAGFVDYYLADPVVVPPSWSPRDAFLEESEQRSLQQYSERLAFVPPSYIVNDFAQLQGHVIAAPRAEPGESDLDLGGVSPGDFLFACFSNFQKMDPTALQVWANILRRARPARLWLTQHHMYDRASINLRAEISARGQLPDRLVFAKREGWIYHVQKKTAVDLALDTLTKAGHTTGLDALWAGVPLITMSNGMQYGSDGRAGVSAMKSLGVEETVVHSVKEYEDLAISLFGDDNYPSKGGTLRLHALRDMVQKARLQPGGLFDTQIWVEHFYRALQGMVELGQVSPDPDESGSRAVGHHLVVPQSTPPPDGKRGKIHVDTPLTDDLIPAHWHTEIPAHKSEAQHTSKEHWPQCRSKEKDPLRARAHTRKFKGDNKEILLLNIGGRQKRKGWMNVDVLDEPWVDVVAHMDDLWMFANESVTAIYSSHTLEHVPYNNVEAPVTAGGRVTVTSVLAEWRRVLRPGALVVVSVPDLPTLARLHLNASNTPQDRMTVMRMMFGGQTDEFDFHYVGFNEELLAHYLHQASFCNIQRIHDAKLFHDSSTIVFHDVAISLTLQATACRIADRFDNTAAANDIHVELAYNTLRPLS